jgi:uncharacterized membrane protein
MTCDFKTGDKVSFVEKKVSVNTKTIGIAYTVKTGKLVSVSLPIGTCVIEKRGGKQVRVKLDSVRAIDKPNALSERLAQRSTEE